MKKEEEEDEWNISSEITPSGLLQHDLRIYVVYPNIVRNSQFVKDKDCFPDYIYNALFVCCTRVCNCLSNKRLLQSASSTLLGARRLLQIV